MKPKKIVVASGKGGTGKTTLATSLALALSRERPLTFLDCDVEEPNSRFFLKPVILEEMDVTVPVPEIEDTRCTRCGLCAEICAFNALAVLSDQVLVFEDLCHGCGGCQRLCPEKAVGEKAKRLGRLSLGQAGAIRFIEGRLDVGQVLSPPVIHAVKRRIDPRMTTIIDAPPGTSCPVMAAVRGGDYALLVTEPTPFGFNDLRLAVETVRRLEVPCGVILNRAGPDYRGVEDYCRREGLPLLLKIPLDRGIAVAYAQGRPLIQARPEYGKELLAVFERIGRLARSDGEARETGDRAR